MGEDILERVADHGWPAPQERVQAGPIMILEAIILAAVLALLFAGLASSSSTYDNTDPRLWQYLRH
jgi:hypothetical protein